MEAFKANNFEDIESRKINEVKENLYFQVHELYFQGLLSYKEAYQFLQAISQAQTARNLKGIIEDDLLSTAEELYQLDYEDEQRKELDSISIELEELKLNISKENWSELLKPFLEKCCSQKISPDFHFLLRGFSAQALEAALFSHKDNPEEIENFRSEIAFILEGVSFESVSFFTEKKMGEKKIAPFFESLQETIDRYESILHFRKIFSPITEDIIIGGSMSYGPFYNVRGADKETGNSSDIDGIIIFKDNIFNIIEQLKIVSGDVVPEEDMEIFIKRIKEFEILRESGRADALSQRFQFIGKGYSISVHCFFMDELASILGEQFEDSLSSENTVVKAVRDFKQKPFEHALCRQRNSSEDYYECIVPPQEQVEGGFIAEIPAYIISEGRLYPGLYQNLISPEFNSTDQLSSQRVRALVDSFHKTFLNQMEKEKHFYGGGSFSKSHVRGAIFAPMKYL